jgi:hypothetical protein
MMNHTKVFELGAEGGTLTVYQMIDQKNNDWYFHEVNDMGMDDEVSGVQKTSKYSSSFADDLIKLQYHHPHLFELYPLYVDESCVNVVILFLQEYLKNNTSAHVDKQRWAAVLNITVEEIDTATFDI